MKTITFNDNDLGMLDIIDITRKTRAVIINDDERVYLSSYAGIYMFPGGKIEGNEEPLEVVKREVKEETGIELEFISKEPFLLVQQFIKNYPKRNSDNILSNRLMQTYYYFANTNHYINPNGVKLTSEEMTDKFCTIQLALDEVIPLLKKWRNGQS